MTRNHYLGEPETPADEAEALLLLVSQVDQYCETRQRQLGNEAFEFFTGPDDPSGQDTFRQIDLVDDVIDLMTQIRERCIAASIPAHSSSAIAQIAKADRSSRE